jgi:hypothetical protein
LVEAGSAQQLFERRRMLIGWINSVVGDSTDQLSSLLRRQFRGLLRSVDKRNLNEHQKQRESCEKDAENNSDDNNGGHGLILRTAGIEVGCSRGASEALPQAWPRNAQRPFEDVFLRHRHSSGSIMRQ